MEDEELDPSKAGELDPKHAGMDDEVDVDLDEEDGGDVTENEDGSVDVQLNNTPETQLDPEFFSNLADQLDDLDLNDYATDLVEKIKIDKEGRERRRAQYAETLRKLGFDDSPPGGATFQGASKVVHPMVTEACVDFAAAAIRELFPVGGETSGPVKHQIIGNASQKKIDKANRKTEFLNWQLTKQMPGFRSTLETLLSQTPLDGAQYLKIIWDHDRNRPSEVFRPVDKIFIPYDAASFDSAERITDEQDLTEFEFKRRVGSGMYRDLELATAQQPEKTDAEEAIDDAQGKDGSMLNEDNTRMVWETLCWLEVEQDDRTGGEAAPYLVSIDVETETVLGFYRSWHPDDPDREPLSQIVEWPFIYWRGGPIGIVQLMGGMPDAATGALRALLDAAHINNLPASIALKGAMANGGSTVQIEPGKMTEIESPLGAQEPDIRKAVMPVPVNPPSPVLMELLGFLTDKGQSLVNVALEKFAEGAGAPDMPVGTALALIEQGSKVYSAIHARLHFAMERTLKVIHNLNRLYLEEETVIREVGELIIHRKDFDGPMDVCPVSDPNIFSETQRFAQIQAVMQRATLLPMLYDLRKVEELFLERMKIPGAKDLLLPKQEPKRLNPINENVAMGMGAPVTAFADQDHIAHLTAHLQFGFHPLFGMNPLMQQMVWGQLAGHVKDHLIYAYVAGAVELSEQISGKPIQDLMDDHPEVQKHFDAAMAQASSNTLIKMGALDQIIVPAIQEVTQAQVPQQLLQICQQLAQFQQANTPPQPQDPEVSKTMMAQAKITEVQQKPQLVQMQIAADQQNTQAKLAADQQSQAAQLQAGQASDTARIEVEREREQSRAQVAMAGHAQQAANTQAQIQSDLVQAQAANESKERMNTQDNATAMAISEGEWENNEKVAVKTGTGLNKNPSN